MDNITGEHAFLLFCQWKKNLILRALETPFFHTDFWCEDRFLRNKMFYIYKYVLFLSQVIKRRYLIFSKKSISAYEDWNEIVGLV